MSTIINARSPYYVKAEISGGAFFIDGEVTFKIYIYSGVLGTDKPITPTYTITKDPSNGNTLAYVVIEISELIRDFLYTKYYVEAQDAVWVEVDMSFTEQPNDVQRTINRDYLAFDGFGLFKEGALPRTSTDPSNDTYTPQLLQDNRTVYFVNGNIIRIPLFSEPQSEIVTTVLSSGQWDLVLEFWEAYSVNWDSSSNTQNITDTNDSNDKIQYLSITGNVQDGDTITITSTQGNLQYDVITLKELCDPKYTPIRLIFYNKYGALQDVYVNKKSTLSVNVTDEQYNINTFNLDTLSYSVNEPTMQRFNVQAKESIQVNTDFIVEDLNEPIKQMLVSENIWLDNGTDILPVIIKDTSFKEKTHVNDKLIQYSFNLEYAFNHIQNVR
jgi:hypothetical protein